MLIKFKIEYIKMFLRINIFSSICGSYFDYLVIIFMLVKTKTKDNIVQKLSGIYEAFIDC